MMKEKGRRAKKGHLHQVGLFGAAAVICAAAPALAETGPEKPLKPKTIAERFCEADEFSACDPVIAFVEENDAFFSGQDRNYSQGFRLEYVTGGRRIVGLPGLAQKFVPVASYLTGKEIRQGFGIAQEIYTPRDLTLVNPNPADRPYAAFLYFSGTATARNPERRIQDSLQINLGIVGPAALGEPTQRNFHRLIRGIDPRGWSAQLRNEPAVEIVGQRQKAWRVFDLGPIESDVSLHGSAAFGNVRIYGAIGGTFRVGINLPEDAYPPRIRPAISAPASFNPRGIGGFYVFFGTEGRGILRDIFLDGNSFRPSGPSVDKRNFVQDIQGGAALNFSRVQVSLTLVQRSESFFGQFQNDKFGALSIQVAL